MFLSKNSFSKLYQFKLPLHPVLFRNSSSIRDLVLCLCTSSWTVNELSHTVLEKKIILFWIDSSNFIHAKTYSINENIFIQKS